MTTEKKIRQALAAAFTQHRALHNITQKQLAKQLGVNRSCVANIEAHRITPDLPLAITIFEVIGISIYQLDKPCAV